MKITPKDTVEAIALRNAALFSIGSERIVKELQNRQEVAYVSMKRRLWFDKKCTTRDIMNITMGELNAIEVRAPSYEYFCTVMGIMLGMAKFNKTKPDGSPCWESGYTINAEEIGRLRFIRAQRCFISIQKSLEAIGASWKRLEMPMTDNEKKASIKRPNRGMSSVCREYCQIMEGAVKMDEVWNTPWPIVYEAFEDRKYKNMAERKMHEAIKNQTKSQR